MLKNLDLIKTNIWFDLNYIRPIDPSQERQVVYFFKQNEQIIHSK